MAAIGDGVSPAAFRRLCVETKLISWVFFTRSPAAFRRLCVETRKADAQRGYLRQPPSGGCVLKQAAFLFGRETLQPAAFRRLCVETACSILSSTSKIPAAFRRLCVETGAYQPHQNRPRPSRLQAAVC